MRSAHSGRIVILGVFIVVHAIGGWLPILAADLEVVPFGSRWRYLNPLGEAEDPLIDDASFEAEWFLPDYDDGFPIEWSGPATAPFAYGGIVEFDPPATELLQPVEGDRYSVYFRHEFQTAEESSNLYLDFVVDDGAVFYLDGVEVLRDACCIDFLGNEQVDGYFTLAPYFGFEGPVRRLPILPDQTLAPGRHVLAVSVHQVDPFSSDLGFDTRLVSRDPRIPLIAEDQMWNLFRGRSEPSPRLEWTTSDFNDSDWERAREGFGYDFDPDPNAVQPLPLTWFLADTGLNDMYTEYSTVYLRKPFDVADPGRLQSLELTIDYDDSFIAYINGVEVARSDFGTPGTPEPFDAFGSSHESSNAIPDMLLETFTVDLADFRDLLVAGDSNVLAIQGLNTAINSSDFLLAQIRLDAIAGASPLQAGDANQDLQFDQLDLVQVQIAFKYLTGRPATWGEGDWDAAPGGGPGSPPAGDGVFDQKDIIAALAPGHYLTGPYGAAEPYATVGDDGMWSLSRAGRGEMAVHVPEPSAIVLAAIATFGLLGVSRAR